MAKKQALGIMLLFATLVVGLVPVRASVAPLPPDHAGLVASSDTNRSLAVIGATRFGEPLERSAASTPQEDDQLAVAIKTYENRIRHDDATALTDFLAKHPHSAWAAALWVNLGIGYLHDGYYSRALDAWQKAWIEGRTSTNPQVRLLVDRAVGERALLLANLGQFDRLRVWFNVIGARPITGSATEKFQVARETLVVSRRDPRHLYLCGPMALKALLLARKAPYSQLRPLDQYRATPKGTNLAELGRLATQMGLGYRLIFRAPGQPIPDQAIVHWKVGHFAAIVGKANGRYHIQDPVFPSNEAWFTPGAIDSEASGFMLVPSDRSAAGWSTVTAKRASLIWGKGPTSGTQPGRPGRPKADAGGKGCPLCSYNIAESTVAVTLSDQPVGYSPPIGPSANVTISYDQREASQPAVFNFYNVGQKWTLNWLSYVTDDPTSPGTNASRFMGGGGAFYYSGYSSATGRFTAQDDDGSVLVLASQAPIVYKRLLRDGSVEVYAQSDSATSYPRNVFLTSIVDPQGNALNLTYDGQDRLTTVTDATGRQTTFAYEQAAFPLEVTKVTDPFGRSAKFSYDASGRLSSITDIIGLTSSVSYDANSLVNGLTTPYGTTTFSFTTPGTGGPPRFVDVTDPLGKHEREEWVEPAPVPDTDPAATVPVGMPLGPTNGYLNYRDSFHWNKDQYIAAGCTATGGCDYSKARDTHFLHYNTSYKSGVIESIKQPLENRLWFQYPGQTGSIYVGAYDRPIAVGRVLDDGATQLTRTSYDSGGFYNITQTVDPLGRTTKYAYSNDVDLQAISQMTANGVMVTVSQYVYNTQHRPVLAVNAAGQITSYTYNSAGQITTSKDALGHVTQYHYNSDATLSSITNPNGVVSTSYTYDAFNRIATITDSEGWTVTFAYDAADRPTVTTYPDGTTERYTYDKLDLATYTDRLGRTWAYGYDANENLTSITDPLGHQSSITYSPAGYLSSITDRNGNTTTWTYDIEGRVISKKYADTSTVAFAYENTTSRLKTRTDALGQVKHYTYTIDNRVSQTSYTNAVHPTATVSFTYDPYFPRMASFTDGIGTTQYSYGAIGSTAALQVVQTTGPPASSTITFAYDELGRLSSRTIAGAGPETFQYDTLGRLSHHGSDLGAFSLSYLGQTGQIAERSLDGGTLKTDWSYLPNTSDRRLKEIDNTGLVAGNYSNFQISTYATGLIAGVTESSDAATVYPTPSTQSASFNNLNQVTSLSGQPYVYDANGNLTSDGVLTYSWDAEDRLIGIGYVAQPGKATAFTYDGFGRRVAMTSTPAGGGSAVTVNYLWCGSSPCQARNASNVLTREYVAEGEYAPGTTPVSLYYGIDQIGSVRRVFASNGTAPAYAYDPYGNPLQATAAVTDAGFAGMFFHPDSGLNLTQHRVYQPASGRWLTRDPMGERSSEGMNLYEYALGEPTSLTDPLGLFCFPQLPRWLRDALGAAADHPYITGGIIGAGVGACFASGICEIGAAAALGAEGLEGLGALAEGEAEADALATARLPQDVAVSPTPPDPLPLERPVGQSATQNAEVQADIAQAQSEGATNIRVNQQQVDATGNRVGTNRPDLQYTDANGNRVYVEYDTTSSTRAAGHQVRILANDPNGTVILKTVD